MTLIAGAVGVFVVVTVLWVLALKWLPVTRTPLMLHQKHEFRDDRNFRIRCEW